MALANGEAVAAKSLVIASGARYRRLDISNLSDFESNCVHYWASPIEIRLCAGQEVALVGAGNSAGQGGGLSRQPGQESLADCAGRRAGSDHVAISGRTHQVAANVEIVNRTEICGLEGAEGMLTRVRWKNRDSGAEAVHALSHIFLFIGADPNTDWLSGCDIALDEKGFVITGGAHPLATSREGVFAIGDVRAGSVKRVAAAVGEGAAVVAALHGFLAQQKAQASLPRAREKRAGGRGGCS